MVHARIVAAVIGVILLLWLGAARAQNFGAPFGGYFRIQWEVKQTGTGPPRISGHLYNDHGLWAHHVQLLVEVLDGSGRAVTNSVDYVYGWVPPLGRTYFEVTAPTRGAGYRVSLHSFDWLLPGDPG